MKIVVIGGTGLIGTKLVSNLLQLDHQVVAASPAMGVNTITGEGLSRALEGAEIVVDVSNSPSYEEKFVRNFFETSCRNLMAAGKAAGVEHHIALSIVGTEELAEQSPYLRAKLAQETLIRSQAYLLPLFIPPNSSNFSAALQSPIHRARLFIFLLHSFNRSRRTMWLRH